MRTLALCLILASAPAAAQELITDRPDFTESPVAVPHRSVQVEAGVTFVSDRRVETVSGPEALVRWSFVPRTELRLGLPDGIRTRADGAFVRGVGDASLGAKVELGRAVGWDLALIAEASIPVGDDTFGEGVVSPLAILVAGRAAGRLGLGTQAEVRWNRASDTLELAATAVVGTEVAPRVGVFGELAGDLVQDEIGLLGHAGLTYALAPLVQLDLHAGIGLTGAAPDALVGVGVSARW